MKERREEPKRKKKKQTSPPKGKGFSSEENQKLEEIRVYLGGKELGKEGGVGRTFVKKNPVKAKKVKGVETSRTRQGKDDKKRKERASLRGSEPDRKSSTGHFKKTRIEKSRGGGGEGDNGKTIGLEKKSMGATW